MSQTLRTFVYPTAIVGLFALYMELLAGWLAGHPTAVASRVFTGWEETLVAGTSCGDRMRIRGPGGQ